MGTLENLVEVLRSLTIATEESNRLKSIELGLEPVAPPISQNISTQTAVVTEPESVFAAAVPSDHTVPVDTAAEIVRTVSGNCAICFQRPPQVAFGCSRPEHIFCGPCMEQLISTRSPCPLCREYVPRPNRYIMFVKQR